MKGRQSTYEGGNKERGGEEKEGRKVEAERQEGEDYQKHTLKKSGGLHMRNTDERPSKLKENSKRPCQGKTEKAIAGGEGEKKQKDPEVRPREHKNTVFLAIIPS